ncbi:ATP-binding protein [Acinetobacter sp. IRS14]|uniref:AAA family ATPase n=1 Tax=Acinetobacter sp. IRS14 TaxID=2983398 RepID=UPI002AFE22B1|nr:AAA family ATPase [Acinetobacter sp. IRS14]MEA1228750.1 ATP-binding protein [Acinetobacter sp. IRS14]
MELKALIEQIIERLTKAKQIAIKLDNTTEICDEISLQQEFIESFYNFFISNESEFPIHYMNNVLDQLIAYKDCLPLYHNVDIQPEPQTFYELEAYFNRNIEGYDTTVFSTLRFTLNFYKQLNYLTSNIVLLGANGSGKSSLAAQLKNNLSAHSLIISAQKLLFIPEFDSISNTQNTNLALISQQNNFNYSKWTFRANTHTSSINYIYELGQQFKNLIENLLAERTEILLLYIEDVRSDKIPDSKSNIPETKLDKVIKIWNRLFLHRELICKQSNIMVRIKETNEEYEANHMSDGEKVALYYIAQILQAPKDSLIIIDEPEMYLHKTILNKIWDTLENERLDCIFLYLTHEIDFAIGRNEAKKYWVRSFKFPNEWDISEIENTEELPENLLLELVGSRKNILFCEGEIGKNDDEIYKIIFPNFTVKPVGSCINVINFTRAFNKIHNLSTQAFGLIDSDHSPVNRLDNLKEDMIFSLDVAEVENLLLDEDLLKIVVHNSPVDYSQEIIDRIKNIIISALNDDIENQAASYISAEIDFYFKEANIKEGKTKNAVESNFQAFIASININDKYNERINTIEEIVDQQRYLDVLKIYNNKGLMAKIHNILEIKSYKKLAIKQLRLNPHAKDCLKKHFPEILLQKGNYTS